DQQFRGLSAVNEVSGENTRPIDMMMSSKITVQFAHAVVIGIRNHDRRSASSRPLHLASRNGTHWPLIPLKPEAGLNGPPNPLKPKAGLNGPPVNLLFFIRGCLGHSRGSSAELC